MLDHLEKIDDVDLSEAALVFTKVQNTSTNPQYRELGGIDKRFAALRNKLQRMEGFFTH